jgi:hypothetical protein
MAIAAGPQFVDRAAALLTAPQVLRGSTQQQVGILGGERVVFCS